MSYRITNNTSSLQRTSGIISSGSDCTIIVKVTSRSAASGGLYRALFGFLDTASGAYSDKIGIFSDVNSNHIKLRLNGSTTGDISLVDSSALQARLAYVRKGTSHYFYYEDSLIVTTVSDVSAFTYLRMFLGGDGTAGDKTDLELAYYREWSAALTVMEIRNEQVSSTAIRTANLVADTPLVADLNDISGNGNHWTETGAAGSFITSIPGTPENFTGQPYPYSRVITPAEYNPSSEFWFKLSVSAFTYLGFYITETEASATVSLQIRPSDAVFAAAGNTNRAFYASFGPGDYYLRVKCSAASIANNLTFEVDEAPILDGVTAASPNSYAVNDDQPGVPGTLWSLEAGTLVGLLPDMPGGEHGASLPDGTSIFHDRYNNWREGYITVLSPTFVRIATVDTTPSLGGSDNPAAFATNGTDFYILSTANNKLWKVTAAGVISDTGATISSAATPRSLGVNRAGTKAYWATGSASPYVIHVWDIPGNAALPDLYTIPISTGFVAITGINQHNGDILVLPDDSLVFSYYNSATSTFTIARVSAAGSLIFAKDYTGSYSKLDHFGYNTDPNTVSAWFFEGPVSTSSGRFMSIDMTDGTEGSIFTRDLFSDKVNDNGGTAKFGPSTSCTFITAKYGATVDPATDPDQEGELGAGDPSLGIDCCDTSPPSGDTGVDPDPVGELPPFILSCIGKGQPDTNVSLPDGEVF